jgi:hypothetical protein
MPLTIAALGVVTSGLWHVTVRAAAANMESKCCIRDTRTVRPYCAVHIAERGRKASKHIADLRGGPIKALRF